MFLPSRCVPALQQTFYRPVLYEYGSSNDTLRYLLKRNKMISSANDYMRIMSEKKMRSESTVML